MANGITFDTLAYSKRLVKDGGFTQQQAESLAGAQKDAFAEMVATRDLATKADIAELRLELREQKSSLIKWMVGLTVGVAAFLGALIIGLFSMLPALIPKIPPTP